MTPTAHLPTGPYTMHEERGAVTVRNVHGHTIRVPGHGTLRLRSMWGAGYAVAVLERGGNTIEARRAGMTGDAEVGCK